MHFVDLNYRHVAKDGLSIFKCIDSIPLCEFADQSPAGIRQELNKISYGSAYFDRGLRPICSGDIFFIKGEEYVATIVDLPSNAA